MADKYRNFARVNGGKASGANARGGTTPMKKTYKCFMCQKEKPVDQFSGKQQNQLAKGNATCQNCNGGSSVELECAFCLKVKSLDQFSKSQRRNNRDTAKCIPCQEMKNAIEPDESYRDEGEDSSNSNDYDNDSGEDDHNGVSLNNGLSSLYSNSAGGSAASQGPAGWVQQPRSGVSGSSRPSIVGQFEPSAYGRNKKPAGSVSGSAFSGQSRVTPKVSAGGWAKPPKAPVQEEIPFAEDDDDDESNDGWGKTQHASSGDDSE